MATTDIERLTYYQRQYLGAEDFATQQAYHRDMRRRHNVGHHTWGIVTGLRLREKPREGDPDGVDVYIEPGVAIDGFGREIIVMQPAKLDAVDFDAFANPFHREVWIAYREETTGHAAPGYGECEDGQSSRVLETFRIVVDPPAPTHDNVIVAGKAASSPPLASQGDLTIPADQSVPYQELPDDTADPRWLVRLGSVNWDGTPGNKKFRQAAANRLNELRHNVGVIAEDVMAPDKLLRLHPRTVPADPDADDFASVEGRLRIDGRAIAKKDVFLHGGRLSFQNTAGADESAPLWLQRLPAGPEHTLRIHIGDDKAEPKNRLTIGPSDAGKELPVVSIRADDNVDIATGKLNFGKQVRQMINLWDVDYAIGVQGGTLYQRTGADFCWFRGGIHSDAASDPGAGGTLQLRLDTAGNLNFGARTRQMLNLWSDHYGVGVQAGTLYFRTDFDFCWFRLGGHSDLESNPGGGALAMKLDRNNQLILSGKLIARDDIQLWGGRLEFRQADGGFDTDLLMITRQHTAADHNDLRVIIGDNVDGDDRFVVGPISVADGQFKEQLVVTNGGEVRVGKTLFLDGRKIPVDVVAGDYFLSSSANSSGGINVDVTSRLANVGTADMMVALSDISNFSVATNARWRVSVGTQTRLTANSFRWVVNWQIDDDGSIDRFSFIAIFVP